MWDSELINRALRYATDAHSEINQKRKYTGEDYIIHPIAVARIVSKYTNDENVIAAALLHDVVEDTKKSLKDIEKEFGSIVASYVEMLTDVSKLSDGNRAIRKEIDRQHTALAIPAIKTVKLADVYHNIGSIIKYGGGFAYKWVSEKELLLEVLVEGNKELYDKVNKIVKDFLKRS